MVRLVLQLVLALAASQTARAQSAPEILRDCPTCPEMVRIKAGAFTMGIPEAESAQFYVSDDARPLHRVTFARDFWLGRFPVTREEFAEFVTATNYPMASIACQVRSMVPDTATWRLPGFRQTERDPVVCVTVHDADAYTGWLSKKTGQTYRLPTESE